MKFEKKVVYWSSESELLGVILAVAILGKTWRSQKVTKEEYTSLLAQQADEAQERRLKKNLFDTNPLENSR